MVEPRCGILLVNVGTPDAPTTPAVRRYLREFLSDPRVIDIPAPARFLLLELAILPTRSARSAAAYAKVWNERGSPLLQHSLDLRDRLAEALPGVPIEVGMRYGRPAIAAALAKLASQDLERIAVVPLFPQYSDAAWASAAERVCRATKSLRNLPALAFVPPFFEHPAFLDAFARRARPFLDVRPDKVLFSFHGLPERQVKARDTSGRHCLQSSACCETIVASNRFCYRAQCFATARGIAERLQLAPSEFEVAFQSRLGRTPWIRPFTDVRLGELPREGVQRLLVMCPSFVADCLETLEEIGIRAKADFAAAGGKELRLVPCPNAEPWWANDLLSILAESLPLPSSAPQSR